MAVPGPVYYHKKFTHNVRNIAGRAHVRFCVQMIKVAPKNSFSSLTVFESGDLCVIRDFQMAYVALVHLHSRGLWVSYRLRFWQLRGSFRAPSYYPTRITHDIDGRAHVRSSLNDEPNTQNSNFRFLNFRTRRSYAPFGTLKWLMLVMFTCVVAFYGPSKPVHHPPTKKKKKKKLKKWAGHSLRFGSFKALSHAGLRQEGSRAFLASHYERRT